MNSPVAHQFEQLLRWVASSFYCVSDKTGKVAGVFRAPGFSPVFHNSFFFAVVEKETEISSCPPPCFSRLESEFGCKTSPSGVNVGNSFFDRLVSGHFGKERDGIFFALHLPFSGGNSSSVPFSWGVSHFEPLEFYKVLGVKFFNLQSGFEPFFAAALGTTTNVTTVDHLESAFHAECVFPIRGLNEFGSGYGSGCFKFIGFAHKLFFNGLTFGLGGRGLLHKLRSNFSTNYRRNGGTFFVTTKEGSGVWLARQNVSAVSETARSASNNCFEKLRSQQTAFTEVRTSVSPLKKELRERTNFLPSAEPYYEQFPFALGKRSGQTKLARKQKG